MKLRAVRSSVAVTFASRMASRAGRNCRLEFGQIGSRIIGIGMNIRAQLIEFRVSAEPAGHVALSRQNRACPGLLALEPEIQHALPEGRCYDPGELRKSGHGCGSSTMKQSGRELKVKG